MNFYTKLISKVDPVSNTPLFKSVQIQLACQACIDAERGHECTHNMHLIPAWHTQEKHDRLRTIMSDRPDLINSEMSGVAFSSVDQCFRPPDLKRMFLTPCPIYIPVGTQLITCIDPCAGGEHSDFALVTMVHENGIFQVRKLFYFSRGLSSACYSAGCREKRPRSRSCRRVIFREATAQTQLPF